MARKIKIYKADIVFSQFIRTRDNWTCVACGNRFYPPDTQGLDCSHYWGRARWRTRFDTENCDSLCVSCHFKWGGDGRYLYEEFKKKQLGTSGFNALMVRAHTYKKKDWEMALIEAEQLLGGVKEK